VRQLSLDLLIDYFNEVPYDLQLKDKGSLAWLPHLGYYGRIAPMFFGGCDSWVMPHAHIDDWVRSWAIGNHRKFAQVKYGDSYIGETYDEWRQRLADLFKDHGAPSLRAAGVTDIWAWRAYLSGYQATHIAYVWACDKIKELRLLIYPDLPTNLSNVWSEIPTDDDKEF
jgi:hypothetical protein